MSRIIVGALTICSVLSAGSAFAAQDDVPARLAALEQENAAMRREVAALRENKLLRRESERLKQSGAVVDTSRPVKLAGPAKSDPFGAYAADLPVAYKARPIDAPGQLRLWGEGGAIWSGGDPISQNFNLIDFTNLGGLFGGGLGGGGGIPRTFDLTPKLGWEAATGFDYRFANSPWHISGQFRYGEGGKTSGSAVVSGVLDPAILALLAPGNPQLAGVFVGGSNTVATSYKENHWLADVAAGYEFAGSGPTAVQVKGGMRVSEFVGRQTTLNAFNVSVLIPPPPIPVIGNSISVFSSTSTDTRNSFLGAGPLIGLQGSVPFAGNWTFDYLGDAAVLFGTERSSTTTTNTVVATPAILNVLAGGGGVNSFTAQRFSTMLSGDIQVGIGYWITPHVKVAGSYRLDAMIHVQNQDAAAVATLTPDRYTHGPRLTVTGQF